MTLNDATACAGDSQLKFLLKEDAGGLKRWRLREGTRHEAERILTLKCQKRGAAERAARERNRPARFSQ